ncbi:hypothetical protein ONZ51_g7604 [Trametes cubensis]|uniref:CFEM domain-containing protein n=1 Tax=Trametes cubensis TaxID=1111947 RepID=A0AAD7TQ79_9APHY|nr:hypothetical protein ONZ51_g7604 [Trametes cubensis]
MPHIYLWLAVWLVFACLIARAAGAASALSIHIMLPCVHTCIPSFLSSNKDKGCAIGLPQEDCLCTNSPFISTPGKCVTDLCADSTVECVAWQLALSTSSTLSSVTPPFIVPPGPESFKSSPSTSVEPGVPRTLPLNAPTSTTSKAGTGGGAIYGSVAIPSILQSTPAKAEPITTASGGDLTSTSIDNRTSISGPSSNGEFSHLSFHQNYKLIRCTTGITSPPTASVQSTAFAGQAKQAKGPGSAQRTVVAALAVSLGASASLAVVLLWLRWRRRSQMSPSDAARPSITASPDDSHHDSTEQGDSELCDAYSLPVVESGEDNHSNEIRRRVRNGQVGHGIQSADRTSTFTCGSGGADQATSTLATLGTSGPGEQGGESWMARRRLRGFLHCPKERRMPSGTRTTVNSRTRAHSWAFHLAQIWGKTRHYRLTSPVARKGFGKMAFSVYVAYCVGSEAEIVYICRICFNAWV